METSPAFWAGFVLIFIYALERFNTPPTNRSSTTWIRYYSAALIYVGLFELTFALILQYPSLFAVVQYFLPELSDIVDSLQEDVDEPTSYTVGVALVLSVLVPRLYWLSDADASIRNKLQTLAAIPIQAQRFARNIRKARFAPDNEIREAIEDRYKRYRIDDVMVGNAAVDMLPMNASDAPEHNKKDTATKFHQLAAVLITVSEWKADRKFSVYLSEREQEYRRLKRRYRHLIVAANGYFALPDQTSGMVDESLYNAAETFRKGFEEELESVLKEACEFMSHGLLKCRLRKTSRESVIRKIGLEPGTIESGGMSADHFTLLLGGLVVIFGGYSILVSNVTQLENLARLAMVPIIFLVSVVLAVMPKQHWRFAQREQGEPPPALSYAVCGGAAVLCATVIAIAFRTLVGLRVNDSYLQAVEAAVEGFIAMSSPWLLMTFVACVGTASVIDSETLARIASRHRRRVLESLVLGCTFAVTGAVVHYLLVLLRGQNVPLLSGVLIVSFLIGGTIGYFVPNWTRKPIEDEVDENDEEDESHLAEL